MDLKGFEKEKRKIFDKASSDFGYPIVTEFQKQIVAATLTELGITEVDLDGNPDYQKEYLDKLNIWVEGTVLALKYGISTLSPSSKTQLVKVKRVSSGQFERRFRMVSFVIDYWERDGRSYIPWEYVTTEWNKANPGSPIVPSEKTRAEDILKRKYLRALKEPGIVIQLLAVKKWNNNDTFKRFLERLRKHYNVDPDTLKTFKGTWLHMVMRKDDSPMLKFLKQKKWRTYAGSEAQELLHSLSEKQKESQNERSHN